MSLHSTGPIKMKRLSLEMPFSGINSSALAWACFYINLHITYFTLAKHKRHPSITPRVGAIVKYSRYYVSVQNVYTKQLSMTMIIKSTTAKEYLVL